MGTPSSEKIIKDVDLALKALEVVFRTNGSVVEGLADSNGHRHKVVGEEKMSVGGVNEPKVRGVSAK